MRLEEMLRGIAGFFVLGSLALGHWVHPGFYLFTAFVGLNLLADLLYRLLDPRTR